MDYGVTQEELPREISYFCNVNCVLRWFEFLIVAVISAGGLIVGGMHLQMCSSSPLLPWWLLVHGCVCVIYYIGALVALVSIPYKLNKLTDQAATLERMIGSVLDSIGMPKGQYFLRDESPVSSFQEVVCNNKDRFVHKLHCNELLHACAGVFFICSLLLGTFLTAITPFNTMCNRETHIYAIVLVLVTIFSILIKLCRSVHDAPE